VITIVAGKGQEQGRQYRTRVEGVGREKGDGEKKSVKRDRRTDVKCPHHNPVMIGLNLNQATFCFFIPEPRAERI
jgi:hypothetical protein